MLLLTTVLKLGRVNVIKSNLSNFVKIQELPASGQGRPKLWEEAYEQLR